MIVKTLMSLSCVTISYGHAALDAITTDRLEHGQTSDLLAYLENLGAMGRADAYMRLAALYLQGEGVTQNKSRANFYFLKAVEHGDVVAMKAVGDSFYSGDGLPKDERLALHYYLRAHDKGHLPGTFNAAVVYKNRYLQTHQEADRKQALRLIKLFVGKSKEHEMIQAATLMKKTLTKADKE